MKRQKPKIVINPSKGKCRKQLPSHLVVAKIHDSEKDHRRKKMNIKNIQLDGIDLLDDRFYE